MGIEEASRAVLVAEHNVELAKLELRVTCADENAEARRKGEAAACVSLREVSRAIGDYHVTSTSGGGSVTMMFRLGGHERTWTGESINALWGVALVELINERFQALNDAFELQSAANDEVTKKNEVLKARIAEAVGGTPAKILNGKVGELENGRCFVWHGKRYRVERVGGGYSECVTQTGDETNETRRDFDHGDLVQFESTTSAEGLPDSYRLAMADNLLRRTRMELNDMATTDTLTNKLESIRRELNVIVLAWDRREQLAAEAADKE